MMIRTHTTIISIMTVNIHLSVLRDRSGFGRVSTKVTGSIVSFDFRDGMEGFTGNSQAPFDKVNSKKHSIQTSSDEHDLQFLRELGQG